MTWVAPTLVRNTICHLLGVVRTCVGVRSTRGDGLRRKWPPVLWRSYRERAPIVRLRLLAGNVNSERLSV